jgi:hypothetical protein
MRRTHNKRNIAENAGGIVAKDQPMGTGLMHCAKLCRRFAAKKASRKTHNKLHQYKIRFHFSPLFS